MFKVEKILAAFLISIGIGFAGYSIGNALFKSKLLDRQVSVKGLSERQITSDYAVLKITAKSTGNNLIECDNKIEKDRLVIIDYLLGLGFAESEITTGDYFIYDSLAQAYRNDNSSNSINYRYVIEASLLLKTKNVQDVQKAIQKQNLLAKEGVVFVNDGPYFEFDRLNELKPDMIAEGIKNARIAAEKFAQDSGSKIGKLKKANQGIFTISPAESSESNNPNYDDNCSARKSLNKKVRLVTTLEYFLEEN
ncbi:MAG: SIMPL domain-containing protein [Janthinobacterium lividum]